jgi:Tol biopolymer transport system component
MKTLIQALRAAGLAAAVLFLPCCRDQMGQGDKLKQVTVRASITPAKVEPNQDCRKPSLSADGSLIAFESDSNNLTPGDTNGFTDIFVRNRVDGSLENVTHVVPVGEYTVWTPSNCTDPVISGNGQFVAFRSIGNYKKLAQPSGLVPHTFIWVLDRSTGLFKRGYAGFFDPDADMSEPTLSHDGRYLAFASAATNFTPANPGGTVQVYITDFQSNTTTLVSRKFASATPTAGNCLKPKISADGQYVAFSSTATDLVNPAAPATQNVFRGTAGGIVSLVTAGADQLCFFPVISGDGRYVSFMTYASFFPSATTPYIVRCDMSGPTMELVAEQTDIVGFIFPDGAPFGMSTDGETFAYVGLRPSGGAVLNGLVQVFTTNMAGELELASVHQDGRIADQDCRDAAISGDGKWAAWSTASPNMVDGDGNGLEDVFTRGPRK